MCTIELFQDTLDRLDTSWLETLQSVVLPKKSAISFGSCYAICGSVGITNVENLQSLDIQSGASISFTQCGLRDYALLQVPLEVEPYVSFTMQLRATGLGTLWPNDPDYNDAKARITGILLITVPIKDKDLHFEDIDVDAFLYGSWLNADGEPFNTWPDSSSILFNSVPLDLSLQTYITELNQSIKSKLVPKVRTFLQAPNVSISCIVPQNTEQTCTSLTTFPGEPCNPCDTCCKCLVQQRCDGECAECPCINCESVKLWSFSQIFGTILIGCFILAWIFQIHETKHIF